MKKQITSTVTVLTFALALAGCAPLTQPPLWRSNVASPNAPEAAGPPASPLLMAGTNYTMAPQPEEQQTSHDEHGADHKLPTSQGHEHHEHESPK